MAGRSALLVVFAALLSAAALVGDPPAQPEKQRLICRGGGERSLGTHMRAPRRCRTAEQWQEEEEAKARIPISLQVTQGQNDGRSGPTPQ